MEPRHDRRTVEALDRGDGGGVVAEEGDVEPRLGSVPVTAEYSLPFLSHATMEPMTATARVTGGQAEVWGPIQSLTIGHMQVADALGLETDAVVIHPTIIGGGFAFCALLIAGLPPLSGFIGKLSLLQAVPEGSLRWVWPAVLFSSLLTIAGLSRVGTRLFWRVDHEAVQADPPAVRWQEVWAVLLLLGYGVAMTIAAEPILAHARSTSEQLLQPESYLHAVQAAQSIIREP